MKIKEFIRAREKVFVPVPDEDSLKDEVSLKNRKNVFVPVITPQGVLVSVQKSVECDVSQIPYRTYNDDFMLKHGIKQLKDVPLSSFAVFDAIKEVVSPSKEDK